MFNNKLLNDLLNSMVERHFELEGDTEINSAYNDVDTKKYIYENNHEKYESLYPKLKFNIRQIKSLLMALHNIKFENPDELRILATILTNPFINDFISLYFAGINEVSDETFLYSEPTEHYSNPDNDLIPMTMKSSKIKDGAEFSKVNITREIEGLVGLKNSVEMVNDACLFEIQTQFYRMLSEIMTDNAQSTTIDFNDLTIKDMLLKLESSLCPNAKIYDSDNYMSILASPDVCTLLNASDEFVPFTDDSNDIFPLIGKFKYMHVYRNPYSEKSEVLKVKSCPQQIDSGLIVIPGIGYGGNILKSNVVKNGWNYTFDCCLPYAYSDKQCDNTYSYFELENLKLF